MLKILYTHGKGLNRKVLQQFSFYPDDPIGVWICRNVILAEDGASDRIMREDIVRLKNLIDNRIITNPAHFEDKLDNNTAKSGLLKIQEMLKIHCKFYYVEEHMPF